MRTTQRRLEKRATGRVASAHGLSIMKVVQDTRRDFETAEHCNAFGTLGSIVVRRGASAGRRLFGLMRLGGFRRMCQGAFGSGRRAQRRVWSGFQSAVTRRGLFGSAVVRRGARREALWHVAEGWDALGVRQRVAERREKGGRMTRVKEEH